MDPIIKYIQTFEQFLEVEGVSESTKKNYAADVRGFLLWAKSSRKKDTLLDETEDFLSTLTGKDIEAYFAFILSHEPRGSAQRKLSSLRKFFTLGLNQRWLDTNPLRNFSLPPETEASELELSSQIEKIMSLYEIQLEKEKLADASRKNYVSDARQFLHWIIKDDGGRNLYTHLTPICNQKGCISGLDGSMPMQTQAKGV